MEGASCHALTEFGLTDFGVNFKLSVPTRSSIPEFQYHLGICTEPYAASVIDGRQGALLLRTILPSIGVHSLI